MVTPRGYYIIKLLFIYKNKMGKQVFSEKQNVSKIEVNKYIYNYVNLLLLLLLLLCSAKN